MYIVGDAWSHMCQVGNREEKRICPMFAVGDAQSHISLGRNKGGEVDLCHVLSRNTQQYMPPVGGGEEEEDLCNVCSREHSLIHVPRWGRRRRKGSVPCMW